MRAWLNGLFSMMSTRTRCRARANASPGRGVRVSALWKRRAVNGGGTSFISRASAPTTARNLGGSASRPPSRCTMLRSSNQQSMFSARVLKSVSVQSRTITRPPEPESVSA
jgi:hypothetical protein